MIENSFAQNRRMANMRPAVDNRLGAGTNQAQLGIEKYQNIAEKRYRSALNPNQPFTAERMFKSATTQRNKMAACRNIVTEKWN